MGDHRLIGVTVTDTDGVQVGVVSAVTAGVAPDIDTLTVRMTNGTEMEFYTDELEIIRR